MYQGLFLNSKNLFVLMLTVLTTFAFSQEIIESPPYLTSEYTNTMMLKRVVVHSDSTVFYFNIKMNDYQFINDCLKDVVFIQDQWKRIYRAKGVSGLQQSDINGINTGDSLVDLTFSFPQISDSVQFLDFYSNNENCFFYHGIILNRRVDSNEINNRRINNTNVNNDQGNPTVNDNPRGRELFFSNKKNQYYSFGLGIGSSYGGIGLRFQQRWGNKVGYGFHLGGGYWPSTEIEGGPAFFYSAGIKYFWYKAWYIDLQFGPVATYKAISGYSGRIIYEKGKLWGPSLFYGGDWFFNKHIGINAALGISINLTDKRFPSRFGRFDFGLIYKF